MTATRNQIAAQVLYAVAVLISDTVATTKKCYDLFGNQQLDSLPCSQDSAEDGPCCKLGNICLSNRLCGPGVNNASDYPHVWRPSCSDKTWRTSNCFSGCNNVSGAGVQPCNRNASDSQYWCCMNPDWCDCTSGTTYDLGSYVFLTTLPMSTELATTSSTPSSTAVASPTFSTSSRTSIITEPKSSNENVKIGVGVGVGTTIPLLAVIGVLAFLLYRKKRAEDILCSHTLPVSKETSEPIVTAPSQPVQYKAEVDGSQVVHEAGISRGQAGCEEEVDGIQATHESDSSRSLQELV